MRTGGFRAQTCTLAPTLARMRVLLLRSSKAARSSMSGCCYLSTCVLTRTRVQSRLARVIFFLGRLCCLLVCTLLQPLGARLLESAVHRLVSLSLLAGILLSGVSLVP
mmetsp:Transcript_35798/g.68872  ORF Transcript_35798/g.68872 Transcript_35798/m.68872 type:complete len:108 (+) Transcript_35798:329-652(+)